MKAHVATVEGCNAAHFGAGTTTMNQTQSYKFRLREAENSDAVQTGNIMRKGTGLRNTENWMTSSVFGFDIPVPGRAIKLQAGRSEIFFRLWIKRVPQTYMRDSSVGFASSGGSSRPWPRAFRRRGHGRKGRYLSVLTAGGAGGGSLFYRNRRPHRMAGTDDEGAPMFFFRERSNWLYEPEDCGDFDGNGADRAPSAAARLRLSLLSALTTLLVAVLSAWARLRPATPGAVSGPGSRKRPALRHGRLLSPAASRRPS